MARKYSNTSVETTLASSIGASDTLLAVTDSTGMPVQFPFSLILDYQSSAVEVVTVTNISGPNFVVTRGEDGTGAQTHDAGAVVVHGATARDLSEPQLHIDAVTQVHGLDPGSDLVGTADTQTLTNKTISGLSNTLTDVTASAITGVDLDDLADVNAATPTDTQVLTFDTGAGQWVAGLGGIQFARKTADTSRASTTTLAGDPHLLLPLEANATYVFRVVFGVQGADGSGDFGEPNFKCDFTAPAGASLRWSYTSYGIDDGAATAFPGPLNPTTVPNADGITDLIITDRANGSVSVLTSYGVALEGLARTAGTSGDVTFRWAQFLSSATATAVLVDSFILAQRVA